MAEYLAEKLGVLDISKKRILGNGDKRV